MRPFLVENGARAREEQGTQEVSHKNSETDGSVVESVQVVSRQHLTLFAQKCR